MPFAAGAGATFSRHGDRNQASIARVASATAARNAGTFGRAGVLSSDPAPGWSGEQAISTNDDWEPAIAADPGSAYVYLLVTAYGQPKPCKGNCPSPFIALYISSNGGETWTGGGPLCACKGGGQFDPIIEVVPDNGDVYALYLNGFNTMFMSSNDHGEKWSGPVKTYGNVSWTDKPVIATSDDGNDVYVSWNGPTGGDPYVAISHDSGATWTQTRLVRSKRYFFAFDADVLPDGTVVFSESSLSYTGPAAAPEGVVKQHVFVGTNDGGTETWTNTVVDEGPVGEACIAAGCGPDFYLGHSAISADANGDLVYLYDRASTDLGPQQIFARTSTTEGDTWSDPVALSTDGENASFPAVESTGAGDVRAFYMQTANGDNPDEWNVWYRSSADGGTNWSDPVKISDATSGVDYKTADGFLEPYGDYGEIAISGGEAVAAWGEGFSWTGPGGVWVNRQTI